MYIPVLRELAPVVYVYVCVSMPKCVLRLCKWIQKMFQRRPTPDILNSQSPSFFEFSSLLPVYQGLREDISLKTRFTGRNILETEVYGTKYP